MEIEKRVVELADRLSYIKDIFGGRDNANIALMQSRLDELAARDKSAPGEKAQMLRQIEDLFAFLEKKLDDELVPMDMVRIVRHPGRVSLKDILENVYDNYTEIGGQDEYSIDPSMLIARAYITRRKGDKVINQPVMVIGQEKGHGQEFRNGGSVKPWGNAKALQYMKVAETERIPIHTYVFTPGAFPVEDFPGAAQQIARNLYEMAGLRVPVVSVISEGGSGGAEAIGLSDVRMMLSRGYYSVISPEGAAAIEAGIRQGQRVSPDLIAQCATRLNITAADNLRMGYVDKVIEEPPLGARPHHYDFFKDLRQEVIQATDQVFLGIAGFKLYRALVASKRKADDAESMFVRWTLDDAAADRLVWKRYCKYRRMAETAYRDSRPSGARIASRAQSVLWSGYSFLRYDFVGKYLKNFKKTVGDLEAEARLVANRLTAPLRKGRDKNAPVTCDPEKSRMLVELSQPEQGACLEDFGWRYVSPKAAEDKAVTCPEAKTYGCPDLWAPDLYGDFAGVCVHCGHHFPMEYQWVLGNVFDPESVVEFDADIEAGNPLDYPGFEDKIEAAKKKTGRKSACVSIDAKIDGVKLVCAVLYSAFRGGSVGAAEGEKFIRALARARRRHYPFLAYVHGTAGIRIQESLNGLIQMPRVTMAVRRYIESGGLYVVLYDTNSYAGPVASFLGCSPYQFSVRSANIGFAGPGVIKETTGIDIPPDYHRAHNALARGHIQGIWDRREIRKNLKQVLLTIGGRNLYYR
ncbi:MAG: acetyl-CoA carboxylase carboxyl transferase subunit alpha/beta [Desulfovibrio sp.]